MVLWSIRVLRDLRGLRPIGAYAPEGEQFSARLEHKFIHKILNKICNGKIWEREDGPGN